jgi:hypothetical protein
MSARALVTAAAPFLAALIVCCGLYQAGTQSPRQFSLGFGAERSKADSALMRSDFKSAIEESRIALWQRPLDQPTLSGLGIAYLLDNRGEKADQIFRVAGKMGWRDSLTQRYWVAQSLQGQAFPEAAQWLDAAARTSGMTDAVQSGFPALEASDQGRAALLQRIRLHPVWLDDWVKQSATLDDTELDERTSVLNAALRAGISPSSQSIASATRSLFQAQRYRAALEFWEAGMGTGSTVESGLWDDDFSRMPIDNSDASPFQWNIVNGSAAQATVEDYNNHKHLSVSSYFSSAALVAIQGATLPGGQVKLMWRSDSPGQSASLLYPRVRCADGPPLTPVDSGEDKDDQWITVNIPQQNCDAQWVGIWFDPSLSSSKEASISSLKFIGMADGGTQK